MTSPAKVRPAPAAFAIFLAVFCLFLPALRNDFVNFDDPVYLLSNPNVQHGLDWQTIRWAFTTGYAANWHPLTWLAHALDWRLFGAHAWGHHLASIVLHASSTALLFLVLRKMTGAYWRSLFVAAVFGIHPLRVESVAWAAELKDVLSTFFWMLTLWAYACWVQKSPEGRRGGRVMYVLALVFFALGLMSKPMLVTLPFALLLLDYWPLARWRSFAEMGRLIVEKAPFFALALGACVLAYRAQQAGGAITIAALNLSLGTRLANACLSFCRYLGKLFLPVNLALFYPLPQDGQWPRALVIFAAVALVVLTGLVLVRMRRQPYFFTGWFWYLGTLLPVIGLVQVGTQAMADRYTYVPMIGVSMALTWCVCDLARGWERRKMALPAAGAAMLVCFALLTLRQIGWWRDSESIFRRTIAVTRANPLAELNLGCALADEGKTDEAISHFEKSIAFSKIAPDAHLNLGLALLQKGDFTGAGLQFETTLQDKPGDDRAHFSLGLAFQGLGDFGHAAGQFEETTKLRPDFADGHFRFAAMLGKLGYLDEAIAQYQAALKIDPAYIEARNNLGILYFRGNRWNDAMIEFQEVLRQNPNIAETHNNLGLIYENQGNLDKAIVEYRESLRLNPAYAPARRNLDAASKILAGKTVPN